LTKLFQDKYLRKACRKILDILAPNVLDDAIKQVQRWKLLLLWHLLHVHIKHLMKTTYTNSHRRLEDIAAPTVEEVYYLDT
jgi:hypothetical protein